MFLRICSERNRRICCSGKSLVRPSARRISLNNSLRRRLKSDSSESEPSNHLKWFKGFAGFSLVSSVLAVVWFGFRAKKQKSLGHSKDCVPVDYDPSLFKSNIKFYRYKDCVLHEYILDPIVKEFPNLKLRKEDVLVASFPKSGTTWLQEVVYMMTHDFKASNDKSDNLECRFPFLEYPYPGIKNIAKAKGCRLIKTHVPFHLLPDNFQESGAKLIYIERDPRDVVVSFWHFYRWIAHIGYVGNFEQFVRLFMEAKIPYTPYFGHRNGYRDVASSNVLIVRYEQMKEEPRQTIKKIAQFLEIPLSEEDAERVESATSFSSMSKNKSVNYEHWNEIGFGFKGQGTFMRKGQVGDWKNHFSETLLGEFQQWEEKFGSHERDKIGQKTEA